MDFGIALPTAADSWRITKEAEELGFTHAWFYDTQMLSADCFVAMGAAAVNTRRIRLALARIPDGKPALDPGKRNVGASTPSANEVVIAEGKGLIGGFGAKPLGIDVDDERGQQDEAADQDLQKAVDIDVVEPVVQHAEHEQTDNGIADAAASAE